MHSKSWIQSSYYIRRNYRYSASCFSLFSVQNLNKPDDFKLLARKVEMKCSDLQTKISAATRTDNPTKILVMLDRISNEVCSIIDPAELCRNVHTNDIYRSAADEVFHTLISLIQELNSNVELYRKLSLIVNDESLFNQLSVEGKFIAQDMKTEMEINGIHLDENDKMKVAQLQFDISELETLYRNNSLSSPNVQLTIVPLNHHSFTQLQSFNHPYIKCNTHNRTVSYPYQLTNSLYTSLHDDITKEMIFHMAQSHPTQNKHVLADLVRARHDLASILGFPSYAHKELARKVLRTPEQIWKLINETSSKIAQPAFEELSSLANIKQYISGMCMSPAPATSSHHYASNINNGSGNSEIVYPWDRASLMQAYMSSTRSSEGNSTSIQEDMEYVSEHLPLYLCLESLWNITNTVFGITVRIDEIDPSEKWDDNVLKLSLYSESNNCLGYIYLDLLRRENKFGGAGHFTIRAGCAAHQDVGQETRRKNGIHSDRQVPVIALVLNFDPSCEVKRPTNHSSGHKNSATINLRHLETLYHEWGHGLHSILSRTFFQHMSGTRGGSDFMEVPSHLLEYFARDVRVLSQWMIHPVTKKSVDVFRLQSALHVTKNFQSIETQFQVLLTAVDQFIFGPEMNLWLHERPRTSEEIYSKIHDQCLLLQEKYTLFPCRYEYDQPTPVVNILNHLHFINYGGSYHSYLFAKIHAKNIWDTHFAANPLCRDAGLVVWKEMLQYGASRDPEEILKRLEMKL